MNLDQLVDSIPEPELEARLSELVDKWKSDCSDVERLSAMIDKWHGNVWFSDQNAQSEFYERFQKFKAEAILRIGGMTLNERLYWFGLLNHWDNSSKESRDRIRTKLHADV